MLLRNTNTGEIDRSDALWVRDLSQIETSYGRLVYLTQLRDPNTGRYEHYSTASSPTSKLVASRTLKRIHEAIFTEWVSLPLERKKADVELYIAGMYPDQSGRAQLIDVWLRLTPYKDLVPAAVQGPERQKHMSDFEAILGLLKNVYGVASPDRNG